MVDIVFVDILAMIAVPIQLFFFLLYFIRFRREPITPRGRVLTTLTFVFVLAHHLVLVASIGYKDRIISCWPVFITSSLYANIWCLPYCLRAVVVYYKHLHNHHAMCVSRLSMLRDAQTSSLHSDFPSSVGPTSPGKESHGGGDGHIGGRRSRKKSPLVKQNSGFRNLLNPWGPSRSQQQQQQQQQQQHSRQEAHPMKTMGSAQATLPADSHAQVPPSPGGMDTCATPEPLTDTSSSLSMDATSSSSTSPSQPALAGPPRG
ncbi:hypothetical protein H696_01128 [Fonticula alba]|uniref:Uncharacterized protein n=1 Tax=Fonticula alba TaxID=691883 RepID=A0A058ZBA4_FONAL|nr:hypothetical protein H696_01128 [Fonticula alba]KCV71705.1 hypothetical protein H696_01128 [Fonticula alba]|eukprot:XP_009493283.1 hypothetical protein H696_01128 [Fonticula alba]